MDAALALDSLFAHTRRGGCSSTEEEDVARIRIAARAVLGRARERATTKDEALTIVRRMLASDSHDVAIDEFTRSIETIASVRREKGDVEEEALVDELLSATSGATTSANARTLTKAIVRLTCSMARRGRLNKKEYNASTHPVLRAVRAHRDAGAGALEALTTALSKGGTESFNALKPFLARALLEYPAPAPRSSFAMLLHSRLIAIASGDGENARQALETCVDALGAYRAPTSESREWIANAAWDIVNVIEMRMFDYDESSAMARVLARTMPAVVRQARDAAQAGDNALAFFGALKRLSELDEDQSCGELVSLLPIMRTADEASALLAVLAPHLPKEGPSSALCALHMASAFALPKESGGNLALSLSTPPLAMSSLERPLTEKNFLGNATFDGFVNDVLSQAWNDEMSDELAACIRANADEKSPSVEFVCLGHPNASVRQTAAMTLRTKLGRRSTSSGTSNVTAALLRLKTECERASSAEAANSTLATLRALAAGAANVIAAPAVLRAISPLMNTKPGEVDPDPRLHALALRLLSEMWIHNREIGWRLRAALENAALSRDAVIVIGCAASVAAAAKAHPFRAIELVIPIQGCLSSTVPAARALALEAIDDMCSSDALDFMPAFKVVARHMPNIPEHPLVALKWVTLLRHGGKGCRDYTDAGAKLVDTLWNAASKSTDMNTRAAAWKSLSMYDAEFIIELGSPTAREIASAAFSERNALVAQRAMEALKSLAHYELSTLSRTVLSARDTQQPSHPPPADPLVYRVTQSMPKKMLANAAFAGAQLFLFRPPKAHSGTSARSVEESTMKRDRAEAYRNEFKRVAKQMFWNGWWHGSLATQAWSRFARRWFDAEAAMRSVENGLDELYAEVRASINETAMDALKDTATPDELQNIALLLSAPVLRNGNSPELVDLFSSILDENTFVIGAERGLFTALALSAGTLDDRGGTRRQMQVVEYLIQRITDCRIDGPSTMGSIGQALGLLARGFAASRLQEKSPDCWRLDAIRRICGVLSVTSGALGAHYAFLEKLKLPRVTETITVPAGDLLEASIGVHMGLAHAVIAFNAFDERSATAISSLIASFTEESSRGNSAAAVAIPIALKGLFKAERSVNSENVTLIVLSMLKDAANRDVRAVAGVILGIALDHGCAIPIDVSEAIVGELMSAAESYALPGAERSRAILALSAALGGPWDGWDDHDISSSGVSDESKVFTAPLLWGGDKGKSDAKAILKTLENVLYASDESVAPKALRELTSWTLAGVSDRAARIAVKTSGSTGDSKSNVSGDTVIGAMMQAVLGTIERSPSRTLIENASLALDVLGALTRLPNANWATSLQRWWQISMAIDGTDLKVAKDSLQRACLRMSRAHPGPNIGREVLESITSFSDDQFLALAQETQHLVMHIAPFACALRSDTGSPALENFVRIATRQDAADGCVTAIWKGLSSIAEGEGASHAIRALTSHLPRPDNARAVRVLEVVAVYISEFPSASMRDMCIKMLDPAIKPVICARLFSKNQVAAETLTALAMWPKETRAGALKSTAAALRFAPVTLRAQMLYEASSLNDGDAVLCVAILAAAWGPTAPLLPLTSIEQCIRALPYTLPLLIKDDLANLAETLIMSLLKHSHDAHATIVRDAMCEIRNVVTSTTWAKVADVIAAY